jgi:ribosomal protein S18 acetylase RimI-like enzyme
MIGHRPYRDPLDIARLEGLLSEGLSASPASAYLHPGDLEWRAFGPHGFPLSDLIEIWEDGDRVVGFGFLESQAGFSWQVAPDLRGSDLDREIARRCLDGTLRWRAENGLEPYAATETSVGDMTRNTLLESLGFRATEVGWVGFRRSLDDLPPIEPPNGSVARAMHNDEVDSRASCQFEAFSPGSRTTPDTWRALMSAAPGYVRDLDSVVVTPDGVVAAAAMCWLDERTGIGLFEPVATRPAFQRQGYGRALMLRGLHALRDHGMTSAIVNTNHTNVASQALYRSVGFQDRDHGFDHEYRTA